MIVIKINKKKLLLFSLVLVVGLVGLNVFNFANKNTTCFEAIRDNPDNPKKVAFACNVDWGNKELEDMMKIFNENDINISFFVSGRWAKNNPDLLREMYIYGHEIGNHGYYHKLCSEVSENVCKEEIINTQKEIEQIINTKTTLFAPPAGDVDDKSIKLAEKLGYKTILWTVDTIDWKPDSSREKIVDRVISKKLNGAIVLMHPKENTVKALPEIIEYIKNNDLEIVKVSELIN